MRGIEGDRACYSLVRGARDASTWPDRGLHPGHQMYPLGMGLIVPGPWYMVKLYPLFLHLSWFGSRTPNAPIWS